MKKLEETVLSPAQIEAEILAEGREWTRQRLEQRLQPLADTHGEFSPAANAG